MCEHRINEEGNTGHGRQNKHWFVAQKVGDQEQNGQEDQVPVGDVGDKVGGIFHGGVVMHFREVFKGERIEEVHRAKEPEGAQLKGDFQPLLHDGQRFTGTERRRLTLVEAGVLVGGKVWSGRLLFA